MAHDFEVVVIGAGVIGLAIARKLSTSGRNVLIVEKNTAHGEETSSRNSEVIHAGIYYAKDSLKSRLCIEGKKLLYQFCEEHGISHKKTGKLIVASEESEFESLEKIRQLAYSNGVRDLEFLDSSRIREIEPELNVAGGLLCPSAGVVDTHGLMLALLGEAEVNGASLALGTPFISGESLPTGGFSLNLGGDTPTRLTTKYVVVAAGLWSQSVAASLGVKNTTIPDLHLSKGNYFSISTLNLFNYMVYPIPSHDCLGIHLTVDLSGRVKFGPDSELLPSNDPSDIDYAVDESRSDSFYEAIRKYWPGLRHGELKPDYAGVRPKISLDAAQNIDFCMHGTDEHGINKLICLYGIESPGLTACLSIAQEVNKRLFQCD